MTNPDKSTEMELGTTLDREQGCSGGTTRGPGGTCPPKPQKSAKLYFLFLDNLLPDRLSNLTPSSLQCFLPQFVYTLFPEIVVCQTGSVNEGYIT